MSPHPLSDFIVSVITAEKRTNCSRRANGEGEPEETVHIDEGTVNKSLNKAFTAQAKTPCDFYRSDWLNK